METEENLKKRKAEEEEQRSEKKIKTSENQEQLSEIPPKTIYDLPAETLENIFGFLDVKYLQRAAQVCVFWEGASKRVKIGKLSSLLRTADQRKNAGDEVLNYLNQLGTFAVNVPGPDNRYEINTDVEENLLKPSILHDLAEWYPHKKDLEAYSEIFHKLLKLGADPNAVCTLEHIKNSEVVKTQESVLERALGNVNVTLIFLLLELYSSKQLIVNNTDILLERVIDNFERHNSFLEMMGEEQMEGQKHRKYRDVQAKIFHKMVECGFKPNFATVRKYLQEETPIFIPTDNPNRSKELAPLLLKLYPGEKNEEMLKELQTANDSLKKQLEIAIGQLVVLKQANQETGKDEEAAELPAAQL